jgi:hypothetical protein
LQSETIWFAFHMYFLYKIRGGIKGNEGTESLLPSAIKCVALSVKRKGNAACCVHCPLSKF